MRQDEYGQTLYGDNMETWPVLCTAWFSGSDATVFLDVGSCRLPAAV